MIITGLENNYYLTQNDIWVSVGIFSEAVSTLDITVKNIDTGKELPALKLYPSPNNDFQFNISQVMRALMPEPNHINNNNLQKFSISFIAHYVDSNSPDKNITLEKHFIRGGRNKDVNKHWYLQEGSKLVVGKWIQWNNVNLPSLPQRIGVFINKYTLTINATPPDAVVKINGVVRNSITVDEGTVLNWSVEREFYISQSGSETLTENKTLNIGLQPELTSTEIIFKIKTTAANEQVPVSLLRTSDTQGVARINYGDGIEETVSVPVFNGSESWTDSEGNIHYIDNGNTFYHVFANPGEYEVNIKTGANISYVRLCESLIQGNDGYMKPSDNTYITSIVKFMSKTLTNLDYTFAGLVNAEFYGRFILETPEATSMNASFYGFGLNLPKPNIWWQLFSQTSKVTALRGTFFRSGIKEIPIGFFDFLPNLVSVWECFKNSKLGNAHYGGVNAGSYPDMAVNGNNDFIPVSLFWKNPKLKDISHCFNYIGDGYFGNLNSGYLAYLVVRREFFWNGKDAGNASGTIENAFYAFAKCNRVICEPNLLKHAPNMSHLGGLFTQTNQTMHPVGWATMIPVAANETEVYQFAESGGNYTATPVTGKGLTFDLNVIFPASSYPNIKTLTGAFTVAATGGNYGFNHAIDYTPNGVPAKLDASLNGADFLAKFPNAKADSVDTSAKLILGQSGGSESEKSDGRNGVFYMLDQDGRITDKDMLPDLVFNNAIPY